MKSILIISPHFYPNDFKCNDIAFELAKQGHNVTVLTDIPNYPKGKFLDGYGYFNRRREIIKSVKVVRTGVIPRGNGSGVMLMLNYLSYLFTASFRSIWMGLFNHYDTIIVHETSPVTVGIPAVIIKKIQKKVNLLFWVLDLWPESLQVAGGVNNKYILGLFERIAKLCYRTSDKILMSSKGFKESICDKGDFSDKLVYFPNWAEKTIAENKDYTLPKLPEGFIVMYAGNIGEAQDFESTMAAAKILSDLGRTDIHIVLVGDGRKRSWVEEYILSNHLQDTVHCVGRHPLDSMGRFFASADVLYFALKDSLIFNLTCPAKLQAYMSAGKPILAMINGEGSDIINEANCGFSVPAGDPESLAAAICKMVEMQPSSLSEMGKNGQIYCKRNFTLEKNMEVLEGLL